MCDKYKYMQWLTYAQLEVHGSKCHVLIPSYQSPFRNMIKTSIAVNTISSPHNEPFAVCSEFNSLHQPPGVIWGVVDCIESLRLSCACWDRATICRFFFHHNEILIRRADCDVHVPVMADHSTEFTTRN